MWDIIGKARARSRSAHGRLLAASGFAALLALCVAACGAPGAAGRSTPVPAESGGASLYTPAGAVRASDGKVLWTATLGADPPAHDDGVLYTSTLANHWPLVSAVRASDGKVLWSIPEHVTVGPLGVSAHRVVVPLYQNGTLTLSALDESSGSVVWRGTPVTIEQPVTLDYSLPLMSSLVFAAGNVVALASATQSSSYVFAWNMASGELAWRTPLPDAGTDGGALGTLTLTGQTVTLSYPQSAATQPLVVTGMDPATGAIRWPRDRSVGAVESITPQVVVATDPVERRVTGLRTSDGAVLWQWEAPPSSHRDPLDFMAESNTTLFYHTYDDYSPGPPA